MDLKLAGVVVEIKKTIILVVFIFVLPSFSFSYDCITETYSDKEKQKYSSEFAAGDKVYLKIYCIGLHPGNYSLSVKWSKKLYGAIRLDEHKFLVKQMGDREFSFWTKIDKMGFLNRFASINDYNPKMIGEWYVESFLNSQHIGINQYIIY